MPSFRRRGFPPWSKVRREDRRSIRDLFDPPLPRIRNSHHPDTQLGEVERVRLWQTRNHHVCGVAIDRRANYVHSREVVDVELAEMGSSSEQGIAAQQQANSVLHPEQCEVVKMRRKLLQNLDACLGERQGSFLIAWVYFASRTSVSDWLIALAMRSSST